MKHHTPIRVLDDFVYSDENAINVRMKKGAKAHWIATFNGGIGCKNNGVLWDFESFAMRLKQNWQTMITYKTNNRGKDIIHETNKVLRMVNWTVSYHLLSHCLLLQKADWANVPYSTEVMH